MLHRSFLLVALSLLLLSACKDSPTAADEKTTLLTRRWLLITVDPTDAPNSAPPGTVIDFKADGSVGFSPVSAPGLGFSGRWAWIDNHTKIRFTGIPTRLTYDVEVAELTQTRLKLKHQNDGDTFMETYEAF